MRIFIQRRTERNNVLSRLHRTRTLYVRQPWLVAAARVLRVFL